MTKLLADSYDFNRIGRVNVIPKTLPHATPASETGKRRNADDWKAAPVAERPGILRRIVGKKYNHAYKGRTAILNEVADGAYELAKRGEIDGDDLEAVLQAVDDELEARKAAAAMTNAANKKNLAKTSPVVLGRENTMPREKHVDEKQPEAAPLTGGVFGTKPAKDGIKMWYIKPTGEIYMAEQTVGVDDVGPFATLGKAQFEQAKMIDEAPPMGTKPAEVAAPAEPEHEFDAYVPPTQPEAPAETPNAEDKPKCLNTWALDPDNRQQFMQRIDGMAFEANIDPREVRAAAMKVLGVSDETQITTSASEALKVIKAAWMPKPEPVKVPEPTIAKPAEPEQPIKAVDLATGEILDAAIIPFEPVQAAVERVKTSVAIMQGVRPLLMKDVDFGVIPGTNNKPVLLKPGAEKLCNAFNLCPEFEIADTVKNWDADKPLFYFQYRCKLVDIATGKVVATGLGSCNSMESKYRWRDAKRTCPTCGKELRKSKDKPEFYCWTKTGGCGAVFKENDPAVASQQLGKVPNEDIFSQINTLDKMAQKRALIAAVLIGCNASRDFTQDIDEQDAA